MALIPEVLALAGAFGATVIQAAKISPAIPWLTRDRVKTMQAILVLFSTFVAVAVAGSQPGGLSSLDWNKLWTEVAPNAAIVWASALAFFQWVLKPHETKTEG